MLVLRDSLLMVREAAKKSGLIGKELLYIYSEKREKC